ALRTFRSPIPAVALSIAGRWPHRARCSPRLRLRSLANSCSRRWAERATTIATRQSAALAWWRSMPMLVRMLVPMRMLMPMPMRMLMPMPMRMLVPMRMIMRRVGGLRQCVIFDKGLVVAMLVALAVRPDVRLERRLNGLHHDVAQSSKHLDQNRVGFKLKKMGTHLDQHMPVAQVVGRPGQCKGALRRYARHRFHGSLHFNEPAVVGDQQISMAQYRSLMEHQPYGFARVERDSLPTAAPLIETQHGFRSIAHQGLCNAGAGKVFSYDSHDQNRK